MDGPSLSRRLTRRASLLGTARALLLAVLLSPALLARPADAAAQTRADSAAVLLATATRLANEGREEVSEALLDFILQRFGDTAAAERVREMRRAAPAAGRAGRTELQVWGTTYGAWIGVAVPTIADANGPEPYGVGLLLGAPTGFLAARAYSRGRSITEGQARAITFGGTWGTWQGAGWAALLDLGIETQEICPPEAPSCFEVESGDGVQERFAAAVAGGLAGIVTGALLSRKPISAGLATTVNFGALWGAWIGLALAIVTDDDASGDRVLGWTLVGGNAGLLTTAIAAPGWGYSRNRARLISVAGLIGGLAGAGIDLIVQPDDEQLGFGIPLVTSVAGLGLGAWATRSFDAGGGGDGRDAEALIDVRSQDWRFGVPTPLPTALRDPRTGRLHAALHLPILRARF